jgi:hypothetical protein
MTTDWILIVIAVVESTVDQVVGNLSAWRSYHNSTLMPLNTHLQDVEDGLHFSVATEWETWGPCVACNRPKGERRRVGRCRVKQHSQQVQCTQGKYFPLSPPATHPNGEGKVTRNVKTVIHLHPVLENTSTCSIYPYGLVFMHMVNLILSLH